MAEMQAYDYRVRSESTSTFGRVLLSARDQHVVVDGPAASGCPGEAVTPAELFLGGVVACAVELVQVLARQQDIGLTGVQAEIAGSIDRDRIVRSDLTVFSSAALRFRFHGVADHDAATLVEGFKGR